MDECQKRFNEWRMLYNFERPHESLNMDIPGNRYRESPINFEQKLPTIEYGPDDHVRKVQTEGKISFKGNRYRIGKAFRGQPVAVRPTVDQDIWDVFFCNQKITQIDLSKHI